MKFTRRRLVQLGGLLTAVGLAGCNTDQCNHTAFFELRPASDSEVAERLSTSVTKANFGPFGRQLVRTAIKNGSVVYQAEEVLFQDTFVAFDGSYYSLTTSVEETNPGRGYELGVQIHSREATPRPSERPTIAFEDLPAIDQDALFVTFLNNFLKKVGGETEQLSRMSGESLELVYPSETSSEESMLVPTPEVGDIEYDGVLIRLSVGDPLPNATINTIRVQARHIGGTPEEFVAYTRDQGIVGDVHLDPQSLTDDQVQILRTAIDDQYQNCVDDPPPAFEELIRQIYDVQGELKHFGTENPRLVNYRAERYLARYHVAVA